METTKKVSPPCDLLRAREVLVRVNLSQRQVDRLIAAGQFPAPVRIGPRTRRWRSDDIDRYVQSLNR